MQIQQEFKNKLNELSVEQLRYSSRPYALIACKMGIENHGKITLSSQQNKWQSSEFRVRFVTVKQTESEMELTMVSPLKGAEIKLTMELNNYYCLLAELKKNRIRFYSEPLLSVGEVWEIVENYVGREVQWVCACVFDG